MFGSSNPYSVPGETQINVSTRNLRSTDHYNGTAEQVQRQTLQTYVVNLQHAVDLSVSRTFTSRVSMSVGVPFLAASWGIPSPTSPTPGPRANENARGLGDISVAGRYWLLPTSRFRSGNISLGLGLKMPTGNAGYKDVYPDRNGNNDQLRFVDQSVQPGDGGWGAMFEISGFKTIPHAQLFGSASYLANPRDRNETTSGSINRLPPGVTALDFTVKDISGASVKLAGFKGKVIVLNFWATWCVPCKAEIPDFVDLYARYAGDGLQLLGLSADDTVKQLKPFVDAQKMTYPVLQGRGHTGILDAYAVSSLPVTVLIGRDGTVCRRYGGPIAKDVLERHIKSLL